MDAACRKEPTVVQGKMRRPVNPWLRYQRKSYPGTIDAAVHGGLRNRSFNTMIAHWKTIPPWLQERSRNEKSWKISLNAGPVNQRSDFLEGKQTCKRLCHEYTAITGSGNKPIPPAQQVRQRLDQQFEGLEAYDYRLEASTGWRYYASSTTTHSSSSSHWQRSRGGKSKRS